MNDKVKSSLYFATLVIALVMYSNVEGDQSVQTSQLANNTLEHVSLPNALN